ncbi:RICIN domain-containing protein [Micromonospora sp. NPDC050397]|uniref:RICIN domain-containing protein n=1 Tax=Micromonospora sp. NPDC050397 TaxID=3364279 RepID=UPI00384FA358
MNIDKVLRRLALTVVVILMGIGAVAAPAQASLVSGPDAPAGSTATKAAAVFFLEHQSSQRCLDGSASQGVRLNTCHFNSYQLWNDNIPRRFYHPESIQCLDGSLSQGVRLNTCNGSNFQQWTYQAGSGLIVHAQSGRCLDGSVSQGVRLISCDAGNPFQWWIQS